MLLGARSARRPVDHSRRYINDNIDRIRRMFRWGVAKELVPLEVSQRLDTVMSLAKGRSQAKETEPIRPVEDAMVEATLPFLSPVVADMIRFQRLTGCRSGEVCIIRPGDVETGGEIWSYQPESHKTEHHGRDRVIFIGPKAQEVLRPYLLRADDSYCFSPAESEEQRLRARHTSRTTPLAYGNRPGTNRKLKPRRTASDCYNHDSYRRAVHRACDKAFPAPEPLGCRDRENDTQRCERLTGEQLAELAAWQKRHRWSPNQLRHTAGTEIRRRYGLEAVQVTLGHASADVSQIYVERDRTLAARVMREVG